jgi:hypothetical protein
MAHAAELFSDQAVRHLYIVAGALFGVPTGARSHPIDDMGDIFRVEMETIAAESPGLTDESVCPTLARIGFRLASATEPGISVERPPAAC